MIRNNISLLLALLASVITAFARDYAPADMPNVQVADRREYVSDPGGYLSDKARQTINEQLWQLRRQTSAEVVVAIPPSIGDTPIEEWSEKLFTSWGIGKKDRDNGVLLVISPESRSARIATGYGVEGTLPDIACKNIIERTIVPNMKAGDIDAAAVSAVNLLAEAISDPAVAEELRSNEPDNFSGVDDSLDPQVFLDFIYIVAGIVFLFSLIYFLTTAGKVRKLPDNYDKAIAWRSKVLPFTLFTVFSAGTALPLLLLVVLLYRRARTRRRRCSTCGARMRRLSETEDNALLSDSQDFEERLNTIDYDVWECPECGTVERYAYRKKQQKYTECPNCHTVALALVGERTIVPATTRHSGTGEKIYECKYCHHIDRKPFVIPKKESVDPLIVGAAVGAAAARRGGGFGGGGFGGGFGGGSTGGGGASGRW